MSVKFVQRQSGDPDRVLRSDICEKEDNYKFFKNSSETRTFVSVTFSKLPF